MNSSPFVYELSDILTKDMEDIDKILGAVENEIQFPSSFLCHFIVTE